MQWTPGVTFIQTAVDAANAMVTVPGEFGSFGHDYREDMAFFVHRSYGFDAVSDEQLSAVEEKLKTLEIERSERIKAGTLEEAPPAPSHQTEEHRSAAGVPLQQRRTRGSGARILKSLFGKSDKGASVQ